MSESSDGGLLAAGCEDGSVQLWSSSSGEASLSFRCSPPLPCVCLPHLLLLFPVATNLQSLACSLTDLAPDWFQGQRSVGLHSSLASHDVM